MILHLLIKFFLILYLFYQQTIRYKFFNQSYSFDLIFSCNLFLFIFFLISTHNCQLLNSLVPLFCFFINKNIDQLYKSHISKSNQLYKFLFIFLLKSFQKKEFNNIRFTIKEKSCLYFILHFSINIFHICLLDNLKSVIFIIFDIFNNRSKKI